MVDWNNSFDLSVFVESSSISYGRYNLWYLIITGVAPDSFGCPWMAQKSNPVLRRDKRKANLPGGLLSVPCKIVTTSSGTCAQTSTEPRSIGHTEMSSKSKSQVLPILALLAAATLWGVFWYPLRYLESVGLVGLWACFLIYVGTLVVAVPFAWRRRHELRANPWFLLMLGVASAWCNVTFFLAVIEGSVVRVILLFYLSPIWTVFLAKWLLHEHISTRSWGLLVMAMAGAVIMLFDPELGSLWPQGYADYLAISSGMAFALTNVLTRKGCSISIEAKTSVTWFGAALLSVVWLLLAGYPAPQVDDAVIAFALTLGALVVVMTIFVLYGVSKLPAHRSAVILLFELIAGAVSAQLLTEEVIRVNEWVGGGLILCAAWFAARQPETHRVGV